MLRKVFAVILSIMLMLSLGIAVSADYTYQYSYTYHNGKLVDSLPAFTLEKTIDKNSLDIKASIGGIVDVEVSEDRIFMVDETNSRIFVADKKDNRIKTFIKTITDENGNIVVDEATGKQLTLKKPQGVFYYEKENELYVADTGEKRIVVLDADSFCLKRVITRPDNMSGDTEFAPSKIVVTPIGKIYFIVKGGSEGIVELNSDGSFSCYFGVNEPKVSIVDYIWKSIATDEIREKMGRTYAPEFSNIGVDAEGFVYAVSNDAESTDMIFRFNGKGVNVIRSAGNAELTGDAEGGMVNTTSRSQFIDIAVSDYGMYAVLDKTHGRVFVYNFDGYLLNVFSSKGPAEGQLRLPASITWDEDKLVLADGELALVYIFEPTDFGRVVLEAEKNYFGGRWAAADEQYRKALEMNANYYVAYSGIGRNCLMNGEYEDAMYYFGMSDDKNGYSEAYEAYRGEFIKDNYVWFFVVILAVVFLVIYSEIRYIKKTKIK